MTTTPPSNKLPGNTFQDQEYQPEDQGAQIIRDIKSEKRDINVDLHNAGVVDGLAKQIGNEDLSNRLGVGKDEKASRLKTLDHVEKTLDRARETEDKKTPGRIK